MTAHPELATPEPPATTRLLDPDEPAPVIVERAESRSPVVFVADHAGRRLPRRLDNLGLAPADLERHIAYDIGILPVAEALARAFDAPLVAQIYSRLVIDCNRPTDVAQSIPEISESTEIPGNLNISKAARQARIEALFRPYHDTIEALLEARAKAGQRTVLVAMHSFTPVFMGMSRRWLIGLLYNRDARLARPLLELLNQDSAPYVGDQLPYIVHDETDYTLPVHGERRGLPHVGIEIRQDLIAQAQGQAAWATWLEGMLRQAVERLPDD